MLLKLFLFILAVNTHLVHANGATPNFLANFEEVAQALINCSADKERVIIGLYPKDAGATTAHEMAVYVDTYGAKSDVYFKSSGADSWKFLIYTKKNVYSRAKTEVMTADELERKSFLFTK